MMKMKKSILLLVGIFVVFFLPAQSPVPDVSGYKTIDEKLDTLKSYCRQYMNEGKYENAKATAKYALQICPADKVEPLAKFNFYMGAVHDGDTSVYYYEKSLAYARKANSVNNIRLALQNLLYLYNNTPNYLSKRDATVNEILKALDTTKNEDDKRAYYPHLADYYGITGEHEKAIGYLLLNLGISVKQLQHGEHTQDDSVKLGIAYANIGENYLIVNQASKAIEYTKQARQYLLSHQLGMVHYYKDLTDAYLQFEQVQQAKIYYDSLTRLLLTKNGTQKEWGSRLAIDLSFADFYVQHKHADSGLLYVNRAQQLLDKYKMDDFLKSQVNYMLGETLAATKDYAGALGPLLAAEPMVKDWGVENYAGILKAIAECYGGLGQFQKAYQYYEKYTPLSDSIHTESAKKSIAEAEAKFQNKVKQQQIDERDTQLLFARKQRLWLIAALVFAGLIASLLIIIYRNKKRTADLLDEKNAALSQLNNDLEAANQTKAKLFSIIGHDLRSPINQVYQFLKLQQLDPNLLDEKQKAAISNKIQTATGSLLETMEDLLLWSKTQMSQFNTTILLVEILPVVRQAEQLLQLNISSKNITIQTAIQPEAVIDTDAYYLQTITRNLLQNAIKASPVNGQVTITFEGTHLSISNQGEAFTQQQYEAIVKNNDASKGLSGLGLKLVDELAVKIGAAVSFANGPAGETIATINFLNNQTR
jgi:signal transduction histidine kinase